MTSLKQSPLPRKRGRGWGWGLSLIAFAALTVLVARGATDRFDDTVLRWVQGHLLPHAAWFWEVVSWPGYAPQSYGVALLLVVLGWRYGARRGLALMLLALLTSPLGSIIKHLVGRPRPTPEQAQVIGQLPTSAAYPSGHVLTYTVVCGLLILLVRDALPEGRRVRSSEGVLCGILALAIVLVGPSRVALGDHWPTDVLGAYLLGGALLVLLAPWRHIPSHVGPSEALE
ncbi:MAG: phosphatase PAP2 family protein [Thermomicrobiales bacterium]